MNKKNLRKKKSIFLFKDLNKQFIKNYYFYWLHLKQIINKVSTQLHFSLKTALFQKERTDGREEGEKGVFEASSSISDGRSLLVEGGNWSVWAQRRVQAGN